MDASDARAARVESGDDGENVSASEDLSPPSSARADSVPSRLYSSDGDDDEGHSSASGSADDRAQQPVPAPHSVVSGATDVEKRPPPVMKPKLPTLDAWLQTHKPARTKVSPRNRVEDEPTPSPSLSRESSVGSTPVGTPITTPSPRKRKRKQQPSADKVEMNVPKPESLDDMELSVDVLRRVVAQHDLDVSALAAWQCTPDGRLQDPEHHSYKSVRDALRVVAFAQTGKIPREDIYYLAIMRRKLAEKAMPFADGPITVLSFGRVIPKELFHSQKKLFPVGFESVASVRLVKAGNLKIRLNCKIVEGNNQMSPIFAVTAVQDPDIMFRSYVGTKAWRKAIGHFESLNEDELTRFIDENDVDRTDCLLSSASEDGFGLLRRNIARILEGDHQVLKCGEYQLWEERHPVSPEAHSKLRSRLLKQLKDLLRRDELPKEDLRHHLAQEVLVTEYAKSPEQVHKEQLQRERDRREAEKQSVRDAARKLLEIELKAQENAKEVQRKEREDRKNALLEAKMELVRQKEARKDAARREKEEEKRMREEEREMRKYLKEEEKRRKAEEKEMHMQLKIDELRERRRLREQQKSILESGVLSSSGASNGGRHSLLNPLKGQRDSTEFTIQKQQDALLKFVHDERDRRRRFSFWERRRAVDERVWRQVKAEYDHQGLASPVPQDKKSNPRAKVNSNTSFPLDAFTRVTTFDTLSFELHGDVLLVWDTISTFSDVLQIPSVPPLNAFVELVAKSASSLSDSRVSSDNEASYQAFASIIASVVRLLLEEYFPALQMGTTLQDFLRARPLNLYSWPEVARQVCLLALEVTHPTMDDQVVKALKGSKPNRDDPVLLHARQRLVERGSKLLVGNAYEEVKDDLTRAEKAASGARTSVTHAPSTTHYGFVTEEGITSLLRLDLKDGCAVVAELLFEKRTVSPDEEPSSPTDADLDRVKVGDYVLAINGQSIANLTDHEELERTINGISKPHGVLMTSTPPFVKPTLKHIPTTQTASKLKCCAHVLKVLRSKEIAEPFNQPVDTEMYPDYYTAVPEPMDLGTIQEKLEDEEYDNDDDVEAFADDVNLVWKNCYAYNSMKAEISLMAKKLSAIFDRLMEEWVENDHVRPLVLAEEDHCRKCRSDQVRDRLLVCDRCDASFHTFCLSPPLQKVPNEEWYCPRCVLDPSFVPELLKKKANGVDKDGGEVVEAIEYTELEKKLLQAVDYLSRNDVRRLTAQELISITRVLAELLLESTTVQDLYRSLEEKSNQLRRECGGDSLADLLQEWDRFAPPKVSSGIECTKRFIVDGIERDLTDDLLNYIEEKTLAERDGSPVPDLPDQSLPDPISESSDDESSEDEVQLLEELGDIHLAAVSANGEQGKDHDTLQQCQLCCLEDGILNGSLKACKQSPLTHIITDLDDFAIPPILSQSSESVDDSNTQDRPTLLRVQQLLPQDVSDVRLVQTSDGVWLSSSRENGLPVGALERIYSVNDCLVDGMSRDEIAQTIRVAKQPVRIFSAPPQMHEAFHATTSIVLFPVSSCNSLGVTLSPGPGGYVFVRSLEDGGSAELSDQVFPGDVLWMIDGTSVIGRPTNEVMEMLEPRSGDSTCILVLAREPSARMKSVAKLKSLNAAVLGAKRARLNEFLTQVASNPSHRTPRQCFDVTFVNGPLGLALALEGRVIVKSLNDNADGTPGQASLCGLIRAGDVIEKVNGRPYGVLRDLSQFTASLVTLPRPITITFSRDAPNTACNPEASDTELYADPVELSQLLGVSSSPKRAIKTIRIERNQLTSLPFSLEDFGINNSTVVSTNDSASGGPGSLDDTALSIGDRLIGVNGCSTSGLPWEAVCRVLVQVRGPLLFHFAERIRFSSFFYAHDACIQQANLAWSDADALYPKILKAKRTEALIKHVVPRSMCLGKCSNSYAYYHFNGDKNRVYARSPDSQWLASGSSKVGVRELLLYLESSGDDGNSKVAKRVRDAFPQICGSSAADELVLEPFLQNGSFALKTQVKLTGEGDKFEALISYLGRRYLLGTFGLRQEAETALRRAERSVRETGVHVQQELNLAYQLPALSVPTLKAEVTVRRHLQRRYEFGSVMSVTGQPIRVPISQAVIQSLRRGLPGENQLGFSLPGNGGHGVQQRMPPNLPSHMSGHGDYNKRKASEPTFSRDVHQRVDMQKHARPLSAQPPPVPHASPSEAAKRQLQPLADHGRAMLTAWNNYARAPTPQHTQALAFACATSFEEVKKATTRLMADTSHSVSAGSTFVCLHHAYVVGLICAMTTQALTNSQRTNGDSVMVKVVADAFATALLCCIDPSPIVRSRAMGGFAAVVKQCDRAMRPRDLSEPLHHIANFILQFVQTSRYLAVGSFDDLSQCRPVIGEDQRAMQMLPASFVQQVRLLENVRRTFILRSARTTPQSMSSAPAERLGQGSNSVLNRQSESAQVVHVDFGPGPLGIMINYSARGKVVVTEYSNDGGQMGQAQVSGKVAIGDEVYAINGRLVESIGGMEGFKAFVASGMRPIRVTFKPTPESMMLPGRNLPGHYRQQTPPPKSLAFGFTGNIQPQIQPATLGPSSQQQVLYQGGTTVGSQPQMASSSMYQLQPAERTMAASQAYPPSAFPSVGGNGGYDSLPAPYINDGLAMSNAAVGAGAWQQQQQAAQPHAFGQGPLIPATLNPRVAGNAFVTPPPFPRSSASMGFPSPPDISSLPDQGPPSSMSGPYGPGFVAPNDPNALADDSNSISYFDANGTTFRSTHDFEIDTTATSASSLLGDDTSTVEGNESILDADTEEEKDDSAGLNSGSVSQLTTPANSDVESDTNEIQKRRSDGARNIPGYVENARTQPDASTTAPTSKSNHKQPKSVESVEDEDMTLSMARRSARVPRKITANIADMYDPELNGSARGRSGGATAGQKEVVEPTDGEVGALATELLEDFATTIRASKTDVPATLQLLRAQLLMVEAAIPRDAFRTGKWTRGVRAAWAEMVYACDTAATLMEATLILESSMENEWLEPWWKASFLPTARYAISTATLASVAMRLQAFDDAISYVRVKRGGSGGRRKQAHRSGASSEQSSPVKATMIDLTSSNTNPMDPLDLPFVAMLQSGTIDVANRIIDRLLSIQRDKTPNVVAQRQAIRELMALSDLTETEIDQWVSAAVDHAQTSRQQQLNVSNGGIVGNAASRQTTPKRKVGSNAALNDQRPNRKRKVAGLPQVSLPCFQMQHGAAYAIPAVASGAADPTLRARLELILVTLLKNELALPFAAPVNVKDVPGYTDVIEQPMDLGTIRLRLSRGFYDGRWELVSQDVNLVWTNCFHYNRVDSEISKCANRLRSIYNRLFEHWISQQPIAMPVASLPSEEACRQCQQSHASDQMLLCDSCDAAYHLFCLSPPLKEIPSGDWFCPRCPLQELTMS